jgi:prephenate dehydratase
VKIGPDGKALPIERGEKETEIDQLTDAAQKVMELAREGNMWAIEHIANRLDGKVREQIDIFTNHNIKIRYESYEEVRAALLEEGINVDKLPVLQDMRKPESRERN